MEGRLSTLATCWFGARISTEASDRLRCPRLAETILTLDLPYEPKTRLGL